MVAELDDFGSCWVEASGCARSSKGPFLRCHTACGDDGEVTAQAGVDTRPAMVAVVADTVGFRNLARSQVRGQDVVVEVGSCQGHCTAILHAQAGSVIGFDVSLEFIAESRGRFPNIRFEFLDIFEEADRLRQMPEAAVCGVAFLDVGGDRRLDQVICAIDALRRRCLPRLQLLVVKSETLHAAMVAWGCRAAGDGEPFLQCPSAFLEHADPVREAGARQLRRKQTRCKRAAPSLAPAPAEGAVMLSRRAIEAALPRGPSALGGSLYGLDLWWWGGGSAATCLVCKEYTQPLARDHGVVVVYGAEETATAAVLALAHPVPVFLGPSGDQALYEHMGSFKALAVLPTGHALRQHGVLTTHLDELARRSRRGAPQVRLLQLHRIDDDVAPWPRHASEAGTAMAWAEVIRGRAVLAACFEAWRVFCPKDSCSVQLAADVDH